MEFAAIEGLIGTLSVSSVLWLFFGVVMLVFVLTSTLLFYHWQKYEVSSARAWTFIATYLIVSAVLIALALISLAVYL